MFPFIAISIFVFSLHFRSNAATYFEGHDFNDTISVARATTNFDGCCPRKSYVVGRQAVTWFQAIILCQQSGMELATITSANEEAAVEELLSTYPTTVGITYGYWIAATRNGACSSEFVWLSLGRPVLYSKWAPGQPDNAGGNEACVEVFETSKGKYFWNDLPCDIKINTEGFICQTRCCC